MILLDATLVWVGERYNDLFEDLQVYRTIEASKLKIKELEAEQDIKGINIEK